MSEEEDEKELPAAASSTALALPGSEQIIKATERIEMHRAAAEVYASLQFAITRPRNEAACLQRIEALCNEADFAAGALYAFPFGTSPTEGINVKAAREFARIWGNLNFGYIVHGRYANESQLEAYALDLESNVRDTAKFTVAHEIKSNDQIKPVTDPRQIDQLCKSAAAREVRNCVLHVIGYRVSEKVIKWCKRTLYREVQDLESARKILLERFNAVGVGTDAILRYSNKKKVADLKVDDIVEFRILLESIRENPALLDDTFPNRTKGKKAAEQAPPAEKQPEPPAEKPPEEKPKKVHTEKPKNPVDTKQDPPPAASSQAPPPPPPQEQPAPSEPPPNLEEMFDEDEFWDKRS